MKNTRLKITISLCLLILCACEPSSDDYFAKCKYGKPEPIFNSDTQGVRSQSFEIQEKAGVEEVEFDTGLALEVVQSGCDEIKQEFAFSFADMTGPTSARAWVDITAEQFHFLGSLSPEYMVFTSWAQAIEAMADDIKLSQGIEIQPGFYVRIDPVSSPEATILRVILSENP